MARARASTRRASEVADREVQELRASSRRLVRVLGFLQGRFEGLGCTPAQCHALVELAQRGRLNTVELAQLLEVDKSTASRTLRPLLRAGLVEALADPSDQRARPLRLSKAGRQRVRRIHAMADAQVRGALAFLSAEERAVVLRGVALYEGALHRAKALEGVLVRPIARRDEPAMAAIIRGVMADFGAIGSGFSSSDPEVDEMQRAYSGPRHAYFVAEKDGTLVAGGGIAPLAGAERGVCELRKMYALPAARGLGIGRSLLARCLAAARAAGFTLCYLETLKTMHQARALYEKFGFQPLDGPLGDTGHFGCDGWFALEL